MQWQFYSYIASFPKRATVEDYLHVDLQILILIKSVKNINPLPHAHHHEKERMEKRDEGLGIRNLTEKTKRQEKK